MSRSRPVAVAGKLKVCREARQQALHSGETPTTKNQRMALEAVTQIILNAVIDSDAFDLDEAANLMRLTTCLTKIQQAFVASERAEAAYARGAAAALWDARTGLRDEFSHRPHVLARAEEVLGQVESHLGERATDDAPIATVEWVEPGDADGVDSGGSR